MKARSIAFLGASGVGKTALVCRVFGDFFPSVHQPTSQQNYYLNLYLMSDEPECVQLIDTSGEDCTPEHAADLADAHIVVFSVNDRHSFKRARQFLLSLTENACQAVLLVANQVDDMYGVQRAVSTEEAERLASQCGVYDYVEMSALDEINTSDIRGTLSDLLCFAMEQEQDLERHAGPSVQEAITQARPGKLLRHLSNMSSSSGRISPDSLMKVISSLTSDSASCLQDQDEVQATRPAWTSPIESSPCPSTASETGPNTVTPSRPHTVPAPNQAAATIAPAGISPSTSEEKTSSALRSFARMVTKMGSGVSTRLSRVINHVHDRPKAPGLQEKPSLAQAALVGHASPRLSKKERTLANSSRPSDRVARGRSFRKLRVRSKEDRPSYGLIMVHAV